MVSFQVASEKQVSEGRLQSSPVASGKVGVFEQAFPVSSLASQEQRRVSYQDYYLNFWKHLPSRRDVDVPQRLRNAVLRPSESEKKQFLMVSRAVLRHYSWAESATGPTHDMRVGGDISSASSCRRGDADASRIRSAKDEQQYTELASYFTRDARRRELKRKDSEDQEEEG